MASSSWPAHIGIRLDENEASPDRCASNTPTSRTRRAPKHCDVAWRKPAWIPRAAANAPDLRPDDAIALEPYSPGGREILGAHSPARSSVQGARAALRPVVKDTRLFRRFQRELAKTGVPVRELIRVYVEVHIIILGRATFLIRDRIVAVSGNGPEPSSRILRLPTEARVWHHRMGGCNAARAQGQAGPASRISRSSKNPNRDEQEKEAKETHMS